jgi:hypothetical protein
MWLGIITGLISLLEKAGEIALVKVLRQHSDALLKIDQDLLAWQQNFNQDTDNRDDLEYVNLIQQKGAIEAALAREIQLAQKQ